MSNSFIGNESLFAGLANANNGRDQKTYTILRDLIDDEFRDRIPTTLLPWDDLFPQDFEELASMVYKKEIEVKTDNMLQPIVAVTIMAKNIRALVTSSKWGTRLWPLKKGFLARIWNRIKCLFTRKKRTDWTGE